MHELCDVACNDENLNKFVGVESDYVFSSTADIFGVVRPLLGWDACTVVVLALSFAVHVDLPLIVHSIVPGDLSLVFRPLVSLSVVCLDGQGCFVCRLFSSFSSLVFIHTVTFGSMPSRSPIHIRPI